MTIQNQEAFNQFHTSSSGVTFLWKGGGFEFFPSNPSSQEGVNVSHKQLLGYVEKCGLLTQRSADTQGSG